MNTDTLIGIIIAIGAAFLFCVGVMVGSRTAGRLAFECQQLHGEWVFETVDYKCKPRSP